MDSRLIYIVSHRIHNISWLDWTHENGGWVFIGDGDNVDKALVLKYINNHFADETLYVSFTRNDSRIVSKVNVELAIKDILGKHDFSIWDNEFNKVIVFNKNGVMRIGNNES